MMFAHFAVSLLFRKAHVLSFKSDVKVDGQNMTFWYVCIIHNNITATYKFDSYKNTSVYHKGLIAAKSQLDTISAVFNFFFQLAGWGGMIEITSPYWNIPAWKQK